MKCDWILRGDLCIQLKDATSPSGSNCYGESKQVSRIGEGRLIHRGRYHIEAILSGWQE